MMKFARSVFLLACLASVGAQALEPDPQKAVWQAQREKAQALREEAKQVRREAGEARDRADKACLRKILVNACQNKAREASLVRIRAARDKEVEANRLDSEAKGELAKIDEKEREARAQEQAAKAAERPEPKPVEPKTPPPPAPSAESQARFLSGKVQRRQAADQRQVKAAEEARLRADKKREDAARYDARAKAIAERKAARQAEIEKKTGSSSIVKP